MSPKSIRSETGFAGSRRSFDGKFRGRQARLLPCLESTLDVNNIRVPELAQLLDDGSGSGNRSTEHDDLTAAVSVAEASLDLVLLDVLGARNDTELLSGGRPADIDEQSPLLDSGASSYRVDKAGIDV
jgi:hypothetical protein